VEIVYLQSRWQLTEETATALVNCWRKLDSRELKQWPRRTAGTHDVNVQFQIKNEKLCVVVRIFQLAISRYVLQRTATKSTKIWKARAQPLFCSFKDNSQQQLSGQQTLRGKLSRCCRFLMVVKKLAPFCRNKKSLTVVIARYVTRDNFFAQRLLRAKLFLRVVPCIIIT